MPSTLYPLNAQRHAGWHWTPRAGATFAAQRWMAPVVIAELGQAVAHFPLVFQRTQDGRLGFAALFSLQPEHNAFVNDQGQWQAGYMPAFLRTHPFQLAQHQDKGYAVMLDEASPVVDAKGNSGQAILTPQGQPAEPVNEIVDFLKRYAAQQHLTDQACQSLDQHPLLAPLADLQAAPPKEGTRTPGLYRIHQPALDALPANTLAELRDVGALSLAYAQLLSMPRLYALQKASQGQTDQQAFMDQQPSVDLDQVFGEAENDIFKF